MRDKLAYIIPLHKKDERVIRAINSVPEDVHLIVSTSEEIQHWIGTLGSIDGVMFEFDGHECEGTSYQELVNDGIRIAKKSGKEWISVLEFDDKLTPTATDIFESYATSWGEDNEVLATFSCIVKEDSNGNEVLLSIGNEMGIAPGVAEEYGYFDFNMLLKTNYIFLNGCYIKVDVFDEFGYFKKNIKVFADYEWTLRALYNDVKFKTVPKATRIHYLYDDGMFGEHKSMPSELVNKWLTLAKQEYFMLEDREIEEPTID